MHTTAPERHGADPAPLLFISHDAWRNGAPLVLLHFLRWLRAHTDDAVAVILRDGAGDLRPEFEALGPVTTWQALGVAPRRRIGSYLARLAGDDRPHDRVTRWLGGRPPRLIYSNTITNGAVLEALAPLRRPVLTHVHELDFWMNHRMVPDDLARAVRHGDRFVAVSQAVRRVLVEDLCIAPARVEVVHEFVSVDDEDAAQSASLRTRHGIPHDAPVVGGVGTTDWRKGPDVFVQVAARVATRHPRAHFVWVGGEREGLAAEQLRHDARRSGIGDRFHLVGVVPSARPYYQIFSVLALTSREDPFPLVCLEAGVAACPVVCFEGAGGAPEFVRSDAGIVTPYLDVGAFAAAVGRLLSDDSLRSAMGTTASARVRACHDVNLLAPTLLDVVRRAERNGA